MATTVLTGRIIRSGSIPATALGGGVISASAQLATSLPVGTVSSSGQVTSLLPTGILSSSIQVTTLLPTGIVSASAQLPAGLVSSSTQVTNLLPVGTVSSSSDIIGTIKLFASGANPGSDWLLCNGGIVSQSTYSTLYSRLGLIGDELTSGKFTSATGGGTPNNGYYGIVNVNDKIVVFGNQSQFGYYYTSSNGTAFTSQLTGLANTQFQLVQAMTFGSGTYCAAVEGYSQATSSIWTSTNLVNWTERAGIPSASNVGSLQFTNNKFLLFGAYESSSLVSVLYTSSNAVNWSSPIEIGRLLGSDGFAKIPDLYMSGSDRIIVGGSFKRNGNGTPANRVASTTNLVSWSIGTAGEFGGVSDMIYANNQYTITSTTGKIYLSNTGNSWTSYQVTEENYSNALRGIDNILYTPSGYIAIMTNGTNYTAEPYNTRNGIYISQNGYEWKFSRVFPNTQTAAVSYYALYDSNKKCVVVAKSSPSSIEVATVITYNTGSEFRLPLQKMNNFQMNGNWYIKAL